MGIGTPNIKRPAGEIRTIIDMKEHIEALWLALDEIENKMGNLDYQLDQKPSSIEMPPEEINRPIIYQGSFSDNTPSSGYISWSGVALRFNGTSYGITNGNTAQKYVYWNRVDPTVFYSTNDLNVINNNENYYLIVVNDSGIVRNFVGKRLAPNTVNSVHVVDSSITNPKLANFSIQPNNMNNTHIYIPGNPFSISGTTISWTAFTLYYNGLSYGISSGSTTNKYVYWTIGNSYLSSNNSGVMNADNNILLVYRITSNVLYRLYNKRTSFAQDLIDGDMLRNSTIRYGKMADVPNSTIYVFKNANDIVSTTFTTTGFYQLFSLASLIYGENLVYFRMILPFMITLPAGVNEAMRFMWRLKLGGSTPSYTHQSLGDNSRRNSAGFGEAFFGETDNSNGLIIFATTTNPTGRKWRGIIDVVIDGHIFDPSNYIGTSIGVLSNGHCATYNASDVWVFSETCRGAGGTMQGWLVSSYPIQVGIDVVSKSGANMAILQYSYVSYIGYNVSMTRS